MKIKLFALLTLLTLTGVAPVFAGATFTATGALNIFPTSMSDDASIVVGTGTTGSTNYYYTEADGLTVIGPGCPSGVPSISGDGSTIVACNPDVNGKYNAAKWLGGTSWLDLGSVEGAQSCDADLSGSYGVDQDGSLAVGLVYLPTVCKAGAGVWDLVNGGPATTLSAEFGSTTYSRANAVNADGSIIVGWQDQLDGERTASEWVNGVQQLILTDNGDFNGEALAVSANGQFIVGTNYAFGGHQGWICRAGDGLTAIGRNGGSYVPTDVTDDGSKVVGFVRQGFVENAFIWGKGSGTTSLYSFITTRGAVVPAGWTLVTASIISPDGKTIYGWGVNPDSVIEMFKVQLSPSAD